MYANTSRAALDAAHLSPATPRPIVSLYDLDTSSYDIDPDGRTVRIYGAAFFRTAPQDVVRFTLVLSRAYYSVCEALADARRARLRFPLLDFRVARRPTAEKLPDIYRW